MVSLKALAERIEKQKDYICTEEATKTAFILPFLQILGYNVFDPREVVPEYHADVGVKKGEKVDYALFKDNKPIMLIECKNWSESLSEKYKNQLFRYFSVTNVKVAILTNGIDYHIYSDLDDDNRMDQRPFLQFNLLDDLSDALVAKIAKLSHPEFNIEEIIPLANHLVYVRRARKYLDQQFNEPTPEFVRFLASQIYDGIKTQSIIQKFTLVTSEALEKISKKRFQHKIISLIEHGNELSHQAEDTLVGEETLSGLGKEDQGSDNDKDKLITTSDELDGFAIIKSMLRKVIHPSRICYKDTQSYFGINIDGNVKKTICRLYLDSSKKYVAINHDVTGGKGNMTQRVPLSCIDDLFNHESDLIGVVTRLESGRVVKAGTDASEKNSTVAQLPKKWARKKIIHL